jgi:hypothetical protein
MIPEVGKLVTKLGSQHEKDKKNEKNGEHSPNSADGKRLAAGDSPPWRRASG